MTKAKRPTLAARNRVLERQELLGKLQKAGEQQRAAHLHRNLVNDAARLEGELYAARAHGGLTHRQRATHAARLAELRHLAARMLVK